MEINTADEFSPIELACNFIDGKIYCFTVQGDMHSGFVDEVKVVDREGNEIFEYTKTPEGAGAKISTYGSKYALKCFEKQEIDNDGYTSKVLVCTLEQK